MLDVPFFAVFFGVAAIFILAALVIHYSSSRDRWRAAVGRADEARDLAEAAAIEAKRTVVRIAEAWPDRALVPAPSLSSALLRVPVMQAGLVAAFDELTRTGATDFDLDPLTWSIDAIALPVEGDVNLPALVRAIVDAVDDARIDLDLDAAAVRAAEALEGGPAAPIEDVLDTLRGDSAGIRRLPIRTLGQIANRARFGSDGRDRLAGGAIDRLKAAYPDPVEEPCESVEDVLRNLRDQDDFQG